jgi:hypothetical protein
MRNVGSYQFHFYPHPNTTLSNDPELQRLNHVSCRASGGTGRSGHTVIRIAMYGWSTSRGVYLANKVADLARHRCDVRVILSDGGGRVYRILKAGGALVKSADMDLNGNPHDGFEHKGYELFTHEKWMALSGAFGSNHASNYVWTGSANWAALSMSNDEVTLRVPGRGNFLKYQGNFDYIWQHWSRWL